MIKAVGFDLWETLITSPPELSRRQETLRLNRLQDALSSLGQDSISRSNLEHAYREGWKRCYDLYWSADLDIPCRQQVVHLIELLNLEPDVLAEEAAVDRIESAYVGGPLDDPPLLVPGALETISELKARGLGLGLISNTGRTPGSALREILQFHQLAAHFDVMVFSDEHGECKPRPSIFERLASSLEVSPEELVFVGDHPWIDVSGAKLFGMKAVHFVPAVRGSAFAPDVSFETVPADAVITDLRDLPAVIETLG
ncbi:MAG TPA: HAD family hydrolase [Thermoanaerobaculia bacterium]|nr:HAD family hydrolase [Thermoanaerobaculia bacterium]